MLPRQRHALIYLLIAALLCTGLPAMAAAQEGAVTGTVYIDKNLDGARGADEAGLAGTELTLLRLNAQGEEAAGTAVSAADGSYAFQGVAAGEYYIRALLPDGYIPTRYVKGGSELIPSNTTGGRTAPFTVQAGGGASLPMGAMPSKNGSFVRAIAFGDDNLNGGRFSSEPLLRGVLAEVLFELDGTYYAVGSGETNKEGLVNITNLAPGSYVLAATMPGSYIIGPVGKKISLFYNNIVPGESNYGRSEPFTLPARGSIGMGIGGALTGSGQGKAWQDDNFNGLWDADEQGLGGLVLTLVHRSMGVERTTVTAADGSYSFPTLQPGEYELTATLPETMMFTIADGDSIFGADDSRTQTAKVRVQAEKTGDFGRIGIIPNTSLEVLAFHDTNVNGQQDEGEPAFAGAELTVLSDDKVVANAVSDAQGAAHIPLLRAGKLSLTLKLPDGQIFSVAGDDQGNRFYQDTSASSLTIPYTLQPGVRAQVKAGITLPAAIEGKLFDDQNNNGVLDNGEEPLSGFTVQAMGPGGLVAAETVTDGEGDYHLAGLIPGSYTVRIVLQSPYIFSDIPTVTADRSSKIVTQTAAWGETASLPVQPGQVLDRVDAAAFRSGVINGQVLLGDEQDGFTGTQGGLPGVYVELLDEEGKPVSDYTVATTGSDGSYLLKGALPGTYALRYTLPEGSAFARPLTDDRQFTSSPFPVQASDELNADALFAVKTGSYAGQIYLDRNADGRRDDQDEGLSGITVLLQSDIAANSRQAQTDADGRFDIATLRPGVYQLQVTLPEGHLIGYDENSPFDPATANASNAEVTVGMGTRSEGNSIAALSAHSLSGRVYYDNNLDRQAADDEPGYEGLEVRLRHQVTKVAFKATTDAGGSYSIPLLFPGDYSLSVQLPEDHELYAPAGAVNSAGLWDKQMRLDTAQQATALDLGLVQFGSLAGSVWNLGGTHEHIAGLPVRLLKSPGNEPAAETTTDPQGNYRLERLYPGKYTLEVTLADGYRFARQIDSEMTRFSLITSDAGVVNDNLGRSVPFTLAMAEQSDGQDIGMGTLGQLGDYAWLDLNRNGMQDAGEPGVPGIQIRLYQYGQLAQETQTDAYGRYLLRDVYPGQYSVEVTMPPELKATLHQTEYKLVASILPEVSGTTVTAEGITVPSGSRNLNCDFGFALVKDGVLPATMQQLPQKDWTPLVPYEPKRLR